MIQSHELVAISHTSRKNSSVVVSYGTEFRSNHNNFPELPHCIWLRARGGDYVFIRANCQIARRFPHWRRLCKSNVFTARLSTRPKRGSISDLQLDGHLRSILHEFRDQVTEKSLGGSRDCAKAQRPPHFLHCGFCRDDRARRERSNRRTSCANERPAGVSFIPRPSLANRGVPTVWRRDAREDDTAAGEMPSASAAARIEPCSTTA